jgi:TolA-binding protein
MKRRWLQPVGFLLVTVLIVTSCAYYNTFFDARKKFAEAERDNRARPQQTQQQSSGGQARAGTPAAPVNVQSPDKYRKVIETCSKLLEFYPNSRWVDDALMLMGMSYYRLQDLPRADRKFTELITIFPKSKYVVEADVWKARILSDQKNYVAAAALLQETMPKIRGTEQRATALFLLGSLFYEQRRWSDAADQFQAAAALRQPRDQRTNALYRLGLSRQQQENYEQAGTAFSAVVRECRDTTVAYDATVRWSKCEAALKRYDRAEEILLNAQANDLFLSCADDIPLELAALSIESGRIEDGAAIYEEYVATHPKSERRGLAFYRLALVHRDRRADLATSKSLLDSVASAGASKDITDSARAAGEDIAKGLLAFEAIQDLQKAVDSLKAEISSPVRKRQVPPRDTTMLPPMRGPVPADTTKQVPEKSTSVVPSDSIHPAHNDSVQSLPETRGAVTSQSADSILKTLSRRDTTNRISMPPKTVASPISPVRTTSGKDTMSAEDQLLEYRQLLQVAYLRAGEFYDQNLADPDSALNYYRLAAADTLDMDTYWKANLYLATLLPQSDSAVSPEARACYENVLKVQDIPVDAANRARRALGLPLLTAPLPAQKAALLAAENAWFSQSVAPDSAIRLYAAVIRMDSTTIDARTALFAQADIYEKSLQKPDSVRVIYDALMARYPTAYWVDRLKARLKPPDSTSVFLMSDEQLMGKKVSVESLLQPAASDSGWPPPEESLHRIRYRL